MVTSSEANHDPTAHGLSARTTSLPVRTQPRPRAAQKMTVGAGGATYVLTTSVAPAAKTRNGQPVPHGGTLRPETLEPMGIPARWMLPISPLQFRPPRSTPRTADPAGPQTPATPIAEAAAAAFRAGMAAARAAELQGRAAETLAQGARIHAAAVAAAAVDAAMAGHERAAVTAVKQAAQAAAVVLREAQAKMAVGLAEAAEASTRSREAAAQSQEAATKTQEAATGTEAAALAQRFDTAALSSAGPAGWDSTGGGVQQQQSPGFGQLDCPIGKQGHGENATRRI